MSEIVIKNIVKDYGNTRALNGINMTIEPNKIYGLLGRNGAGKTTLLNLITNKIFPTTGEIKVDGLPVLENDEALNKIFYMVEKNLYPAGMKVKDAFKWTREFYTNFDMDYADRLSTKFGLKTNKKIKTLSTGYTSIFKAIVTLATNAPIMMFDEPVLGLDANHRSMLYKELIANYSENPKTIIISTHLIEEVAEVLEEAIIIKEGRLIAKNSVEQLLSSAYQVSGEINKVDEYIKGRSYVGEETMGRFKTVTVLEDIGNKNEVLANQLGLDFSKAELQKLFISLTN